MTNKRIYEEIYSIIKNIPEGRVASYGLIASIHGGCTARMVGNALSKSESKMKLPWHRVINSQGRISFKDPEDTALQRSMLEAEGIVFKGDRIDLKKYGWKIFEGTI